MTNRSLVTGGAGFIGSHIVEALLEAGHEVGVIDNLSTGSKDNLPGSVVFEHLDIGCPSARAAVARWRPNNIFHLAAQIDVRVSVSQPQKDAHANILGTLNMLEAACLAGAENFIFTSTGGAIYGEQEVFPATEAHPCAPTSPYGTSKLCAEHYIDYFRREHGLRTASLRLGNVYGPRQDPHGEAGVVAIFCGKLLSSQAPWVFGDGEQTRDYVYVGDVAQAALAAVECAGQVSGAINVGTGIETSVNHLLKLLQEHAASTLQPEYQPPRKGEQQRSCISPALAREQLGWSPQVALADGLGRTYDWFAQRHVKQPLRAAS